MKIRQPSVAGTFYPGNKEDIQRLFESILINERDKINYEMSSAQIIGGVVPHAGYIYSGYEAAHFYEIIRKANKKTDTFIIIHPNHTGYGINTDLDENEYWETPLGKVPVDMEFAGYLSLPVSSIAHCYEHSGEVHVPFLQHFISYDFKILPVSMLHQDYEHSCDLARQIFEANKNLNKNIILIASSDFSHFVEPETGKKLDNMVIENIEAMNSPEVEKTIKKNRISVCGYGPIMTLIEYSKMLSSSAKIKLIARGNSGKAGPKDSVVDYVTCLAYY